MHLTIFKRVWVLLSGALTICAAFAQAPTAELDTNEFGVEEQVESEYTLTSRLLAAVVPVGEPKRCVCECECV